MSRDTGKSLPTNARLPQDPVGRPCLLMGGLLSVLSDGRLGPGLLRRFVERHAANCPRCALALGSLVVLQTRLRVLRRAPSQTGESPLPHLAPERQQAVESRWDALDREISAAGPHHS